MYQIFERINTSGRALKPQEIRNCVYHGKFNQFLFSLNKEQLWRDVLGSQTEDSRMADVELVLRFFAFTDILSQEEMNQKQINLVKYLNTFMSKYNDISREEEEKKRKQFLEIIGFLFRNIGNNLFRTGTMKNGVFVWAKKVNPVVFDALCTATVLVGENAIVENLLDKYKVLLQDTEFDIVTRQRTTNTENIKKRIFIAAKMLYGIEL